eukprot:Tbor_TRINITY_DN1393_c0_g1::TRINITY_DN1393_c0_g1_i1::g.12480::m.12480
MHQTHVSLLKVPKIELRMLPKVHATVEDYINRRWAVLFSTMSPAYTMQQREMERVLEWYGLKYKKVLIDRHPHVDQLLTGMSKYISAAESKRLEVISNSPRSTEGALGFTPSFGKKFPSNSLSNSSNEKQSDLLRSKLISCRSNVPYTEKQLPLLFINKLFIGSIGHVKELEEARMLKDILHFGFEWKSNPNGCLQPLTALYNDKSQFKGQYRGAPVSKPVTMMPQLSPHVNIDIAGGGLAGPLND